MYKYLLIAGLLWLLCGCESLLVTGGIPVPYPESYPEPPPQAQGSTVIYHPSGLFPSALHIPPGHLPPPGSCRIWYPDRPPGQQPPPGHFESLAGRVPPGAWLLYRPPQEENHVHVRVYDQERPGVVVVIRVFNATTGKFVRDLAP
jgi:hypothetical protein